MRKEILEYLTYQDLAPKTTAQHLRHLYGLAAHAEMVQGDHEDINVILGYLATLKPWAKVRGWTILHRFFTWKLLEGRVKASPMARVPKPKATSKPRSALESDALLGLLKQLDLDISSAAEKPPKRFGAVRLKTVMYLGLYYGLRPGECCNIQKADYKPDRKIIYCRRKHGDLTIPLDPDINALLLHWLSLRDSVAQKGVTSLFVTWSGRPLTTQGTRSQLEKLAARAGITLDRGGLHQLRHTMAEIMAGRGEKLTEIARYLGHKNLSSTDHYLRKHFGAKNQTGRDIVRSLLDSAEGPDKQKREVVKLRAVNQADPEDVPF